MKIRLVDKKDYLKDWRIKYLKDNKKRLRAESREKRNTLEGYIKKLASRCREMTLDTDIDEYYIRSLFRGCEYCCTITKMPFQYRNPSSTFHNPYAPSIDQIIPSMGYYKDNVQLLTVFTNKAKSDLPVGEFIQIMNSIIERGKLGGDLVYDLHR